MVGLTKNIVLLVSIFFACHSKGQASDDLADFDEDGTPLITFDCTNPIDGEAPNPDNDGNKQPLTSH